MSVCVLDTNLLLRLFDRNDPDYAAVHRMLADLVRRKVEIATVSQCHREFWSVATRPTTARGGLGLTPAKTAPRIRYLVRRIYVHSATEKTAGLWLDLVEAFGVVGVATHDAYIVATIHSHGLHEIATLNSSDFSRYADSIRVVDPRSAYPQ